MDIPEDIFIHSQRAEPQVPPKPARAVASVQTMKDADLNGAAAHQTSVTIQTESTEPSFSPPSEPMSSVVSTSVGSKRDMGTFTEQRLMQCKERFVQTNGSQSPKMTSTQTCEIQATPQVPLTTKTGGLHHTAKPSDEITRNYIPKAGLTTYTVVPPKSLDKLRFFEVELTLESASMPGAEEVPDDVFDYRSSSTSPPYKFEKIPGNSSLPPYTVSPSSSSCPVVKTETVPPPVRYESRSGSGSSLSQSSSSSPVSPGVKEKKVPPSVRPKPASFRLPQHNKTPGSYVSSAAVRSMSLSDSTESGSLRESLGSPQKDYFPVAAEDSFPPPPAPIQWEEERESKNDQHVPSPSFLLKQENGNSPVSPVFSPTGADKFSGSPRSGLLRQSSLPSPSLTLEKLRNFAAPKPYSPNPPRSFAQTVFSTAKRTQSLNHSSVGQSGNRVPLALTRRSPLRESDELPDSPTNKVSIGSVCVLSFNRRISFGTL